ncbi:NADH:flavin oxidoreductase [Belnapia sp. F-4-1]|uniref:NADH:flavin oxidoreductase n=1 Tax=Belnapia sp. F-4-1 TaxID=1545443 RepID=UPI00068B3DC2|nr:NADH:flavin oxidoreductase [Belnapia sp. F-4-1]
MRTADKAHPIVDAAAASLFQPLSLGGLVLPNRLAVAPMTRVSADEDGRASARMAHYYERFARGGFGMVVTEGIYTDQQFSQGYRFQPGMSDDGQADSWKPVLFGIQAHGVPVVAQLMHAGAISQGNRFREGTVAPSVIQPQGRQMPFYYGTGTYGRPSAMTDAQIADAVAGFGNAAKRAVAVAGFDAVEIHGANGYLLDQFMTDYTNAREDRWGGSTRSRIRLSLEVLKEVRHRVGAAVPVGVRISQAKVNDFSHKWQRGEEDAEVIFGSLGDAGVDFIHVTEFEAWKPAFGDAGPTLVHLAKKYAPAAAVVANGNLHEVGKAMSALGDGADMVAFGRGALANPDLPKRFAAQLPLRDFDPVILGPLADIKASELSL